MFEPTSLSLNIYTNLHEYMILNCLFLTLLIHRVFYTCPLRFVPSQIHPNLMKFIVKYKTSILQKYMHYKIYSTVNFKK
jgi:hypothetical protein